MLAWNRAINLTAITEPAAVARLHVADSLAAVPTLAAERIAAFVDLGSGAGFPALPLAVVLGTETCLVESVGKKARFLEASAVAAGLATRVRVAASRAETFGADPAHREQWPAVTARAVAGLADLVELAFPLLRPGGILVAWKRGEIDPELAAAGRAAEALGGGVIEVQPTHVGTLPGHVLVIVRKRGSSPREYPRDPAARRRRPW